MQVPDTLDPDARRQNEALQFSLVTQTACRESSATPASLRRIPMRQAIILLTEQLSHQKAKSKSHIPAERLAVMDGETETLRQSGIIQRALNVGAQCPDVELVDAHGQSTSLRQFSQNGPSVLVFYRGG